MPDAGEYSYLSCPIFLGSLSYYYSSVLCFVFVFPNMQKNCVSMHCKDEKQLIITTTEWKQTKQCPLVWKYMPLWTKLATFFIKKTCSYFIQLFQSVKCLAAVVVDLDQLEPLVSLSGSMTLPVTWSILLVDHLHWEATGYIQNASKKILGISWLLDENRDQTDYC